MSKQDPFKVAKDLLAKHGENIVRSGDAMVSDKHEMVSVSPLIDVNIGGGIPLPLFRFAKTHRQWVRIFTT